MVATFILTRAFAISALVAGAFTGAFAAPLPSHEVGAVHSRDIEARFCRQMGCLFEVPTDAQDVESTGTAEAETDRIAVDGTEAVFTVAGGDEQPATEPSEDEAGEVDSMCIIGQDFILAGVVLSVLDGLQEHVDGE